ncbi:hypothetical protein Acr_00g0008460 [Actinidia rufa]|uniref:Uncharacterized protein n=1 Tax=Actinidia rufa TaxID=165716 RepID=A0A7J0D8N9_9ERIC|nr:hypothetical protein Acr_00g0008460 [Actinidia rufa]
MFLFLCAAHTTSDLKGYVPFTWFLTELFRRNGVCMPLDLIRNEPKGAIDRSSLSRSEGQRKKRRLKAMVLETEQSFGMTKLKKEIAKLRAKMNTHMTALEEEFGRHTTMF